MTQYRDPIIIFIVASILAFIGCSHEVDHISSYVMQTTKELSWIETFGMYHLPEPMNDYGFRPTSVMLMKAFAAMTDGNLAMPPVWIVFTKGFLSCALLGWSTLAWQKSHEHKAYPALIACLVMISAPQLFSMWRLSELDSIGAAALLFCSANLNTKSRSSFRNTIAFLLLFACATIKESIAVTAFAILYFEMATHWRKGSRQHAKKMTMWISITAVIWLFSVREMLIGDQGSRLGEAPIEYRALIAHFTSLQIIYLIGISGCLLLAINPLLTRVKPNYAVWVILLGIGVQIALPPLISLNHYETLYYSPRWMATIIGSLAWVGLLASFVSDKCLKSQHLIGYPLIFMLVFFGVIISSNNIREDFAARLFLPALPALFIILQRILYAPFTKQGSKALRWSLIIMLCNVLWHIASNGYNAAVERWSRDTVNKKGIERIISQNNDSRLFYYNDFERELNATILIQMGAIKTWANDNQYVYKPDHPEGCVRMNNGFMNSFSSPPLLYWLGQKSKVSQESAIRLLGEFDWKDFDYTGPDGEEQCTPLRFQEDLRKGIYSTVDPSTKNGTLLWGYSSDYHLISTSLLEGPRRLITQLPLIEKRTYSALLIETGGWNDTP